MTTVFRVKITLPWWRILTWFINFVRRVCSLSNPVKHYVKLMTDWYETCQRVRRFTSHNKKVCWTLRDDEICFLPRISRGSWNRATESNHSAKEAIGTASEWRFWRQGWQRVCPGPLRSRSQIGTLIGPDVNNRLGSTVLSPIKKLFLHSQIIHKISKIWKFNFLPAAATVAAVRQRSGLNPDLGVLRVFVSGFLLLRDRIADGRNSARARS